MRASQALLSLTLSAFAVLAFAGRAMAEDTKIRAVLDWNFEGEHAEFTVPLEDGTYKKSHLDIQLDRGAGSGDTVTKVASGAYDVGYADLYAMVRFNAANPDRRLIAVALNQDSSAVGIATLASGPIKQPQDLMGHKLASPPDAGNQLFPLFAAANKIDSSAINWMNVASDIRDTLLVRGQADAVTGNVTTTIMNARAMGVPDGGVRTFIYASYGVPLYGSSIITKPEFARAHPAAIRDFIRGLAHGINAMIIDPVSALATVKKHEPLLDDKIELERMKISLQYMLITDHVLAYGLSQVDPTRLQKTLDEVSGPFAIKQPPKASEVYTAEYLPPAAELKILPWHPGQ